MDEKTKKLLEECGGKLTYVWEDETVSEDVLKELGEIVNDLFKIVKFGSDRLFMVRKGGFFRLWDCTDDFNQFWKTYCRNETFNYALDDFKNMKQADHLILAKDEREAEEKMEKEDFVGIKFSL